MIIYLCLKIKVEILQNISSKISKFVWACTIPAYVDVISDAGPKS